jgi:CheY-like chemotaxis protein
MNILLIDDERTFSDNRVSMIAKDVDEALKILSLEISFDEIWLDFNLLGMDSIIPVLRYLKQQYNEGKQIPVGKFFIHASGDYVIGDMFRMLQEAGYENIERVRWNQYLEVLPR